MTRLEIFRIVFETIARDGSAIAVEFRESPFADCPTISVDVTRCNRLGQYDGLADLEFDLLQRRIVEKLPAGVHLVLSGVLLRGEMPIPGSPAPLEPGFQDPRRRELVLSEGGRAGRDPSVAAAVAGALVGSRAAHRLAISRARVAVDVVLPPDLPVSDGPAWFEGVREALSATVRRIESAGVLDERPVAPRKPPEN
jgi:hypothetical protein